MGWNQQNNFVLLIVQAGTGFSGLFVYSPSPGAGNLIASIAAQAGTDPYGNAYNQGLELFGSFNLLWMSTKDASEVAPGQMLVSAIGTPGTTRQLITQIFTPLNAGVRAALQLASQSVDGTIPPSATFGEDVLIFGSALTTLVGSVPETAHSFTFANGWTADGARQKCRYFLAAAPAASAAANESCVCVGGTFIVPAGFAAGQAMTTAAIAAYQPANAAPLIGYDNTANGPVSFLWRASGILEFHKGLGTAVAVGDSLELPYQLVFLNN